VAVVWSEPYRVYAGYDASGFTALEREPVDWNASTGFQITEPAQHVGWLTLVYAARIEYAQAVRGQMSGDVYCITAESLREYVADYGGSEAWHSTGAYRVRGDAWDAAVRALKQANGVTL
jgi:hypothetical protein